MNRNYRWRCGDLELLLGELPAIVGVVNVTPDSFSDGGQFLDPGRAVARALEMIAEGAGVIDIGGESTRPGSAHVPAAEQVRRTAPVIAALARQTEVPVSIDTTDATVAAAALEAGARVLNDISALRGPGDMAALAAQTGAGLILMHMQGTPQTMQQQPRYDDVVAEVRGFLAERIDAAVAAGVSRSQLAVDPGIGFGKTVAHNLSLLKHVDALHELAVPVLVGPSRKSFIGKVLGLEDPAERIWGTAAVVAHCVAAGVQLLRVHDVAAMIQVTRLLVALRQAD